MAINLGTLGALAIDIGANLARFESDMGRADRIAQQRMKSISASIGRGIKVAVAEAAAAGAAATLAVSKAIDRADALEELSQKVGTSTEKLSRLEFGAQLEGVEDFAGAMGKLSRSIVEAQDKNSGAAKAFAALGISVVDAQGNLRDTSDVMRDMAGAFADSKDGAVENAIAVELLGKSGADAIPFLNGGTEALDRYAAMSDRLGMTIDQKTAKAAGAFNDQMFIGAKAIGGLATRVAAGLLPTMTDLAEQFVDYSTNAENAKRITDGISTAVRGFIAGGLILKTTLVAVGETAGTTFGYIARILERADLNVTDGLIPIKGLIKLGMAVRDESQVIGESVEGIREKVSREMDAIAEVWNAGGEQITQAADGIEKGAEKTKRALVFGGSDETSKAIQKAGDSLRALDVSLRQQVETFGMGESAALRYRLTIGDLSDEVRALGSEGLRLAKSIEDQAIALQNLKVAAEAEAEARRKAQQFAQQVEGRDSSKDVRSRLEEVRRASELGGLGAFGKVQGGLADARDIEAQRALEERERLQADYDQRLLTTQEFQAAIEASEREHQERMRQIETTGAEAKKQMYANAFGALEKLGGDFQASVLAQSKSGFEISKAISIVQATISTYRAAVEAYAALAGIPYVGPVLGGAAAAAAIGFGLAQVAAIKSTKFQGRRFGGPTGAGGMYEVTEDGPELLRVGNRTLLMMGQADGYVSPAQPGGARLAGPSASAPAQVTINNYERVGVGATSRTGPNGDQLIEITIGKQLDENGPIARRLQATYGLQRRPTARA